MQDNKDINIFLEDIERSISEIFEFLPEKRNFIEFQKDLKTRKAVERNIEIIGEAMVTPRITLGITMHSTK